MGSPRIGREEVTDILRMVGGSCRVRIPVYLVGGGAMALRGEKDATKDLDLILESQAQAEELKRAFEEHGFEVNARRPVECRAMVDAEILSGASGLRADIFVGRICDKLRFSEGMKERAEFVAELGRIVLHMCSREDIFLLKSVTERSRDLDDMVVLFRNGLERDVILGECERQSALEGLRGSQIWEAFLLVKIEEMESRYGIRVPWKRTLRAVAETKMGAQRLLAHIDRGIRTVGELSVEFGEDQAFIRKCLHYLEDESEVTLDRRTVPHRILPSKRSGQ